MYRQIFIPTEKNHNIELPPEFYGKQVEVIAFEIGNGKETNPKKDFLSDIEAVPDFPSIEQIRKNAWCNNSR
ncbi:MAG: hypothetical protein V4649_10280 [Bacteroidota bacterium]